MEYQVAIGTVVEQMVAAARQRTTYKEISRQIGTLLSHPWAFLKKRSELRADGHNVAIYWDETGEGSIEVGVQVTARFDGSDEVVCSATPAGTVARKATATNAASAAPNGVQRNCSMPSSRRSVNA